MKIKKGDNVIVIAGKDKGKAGKIVRALPMTDQVIIEGINVVTKHSRATARTKKGQIIEKTMPVHISNVMLKDPKTGKPTRIRIERKDGVRQRVAVKSGSKIN